MGTMATIKSYTDLEQSRKLAEFLPIESADMHYKVNRYNNESKIFMIPYSELGCYKDNEYQYCVCAWSLAALLRAIPKRIKDYRVLQIDINEKDFSIWYDGIEGLINTKLPDITMECLVDACYEMIIKLHELKML